MADYFVYILSNKSRMLYAGATNNLERRLFEHRERFVPGFPERFGLTRLVYYEVTGNVEAAITREKEIKGWVRRKKVALIHSLNPEWRDLSEEWMPPSQPVCHSERAKRTNEYRGGVKRIPIRPDTLRSAQCDKTVGRARGI